jgi:murein L,D-transpeptidase YcbB/YkuD
MSRVALRFQKYETSLTIYVVLVKFECSLMKCVIALTALSLAAAVAQASGPVKATVHHAKPASTGKAATPKASSAKSTPPSTRSKAKSTKAQQLVASSSSGSSTRAGSKTSRRGRYNKSRVARVRAPSYQTHPDPERYQEIQKALADRGYLKSEPNGQWDNDSIDALKRFQADQKLDTDGKINARTLMGLGLGPKHDGGSVASAAPPQPPPAAEQGAIPQ